MVKITVIGWYGTETIGDRAILTGLISLFSSVYESFHIHLGAIYPFFTERTLLDDFDFMKECSSSDLEISLFDTQKIKDLDHAICNCDVLVMGGGPLMGMYSLFMIEYAFEKARKLHKRTMILGCGVGPMRRKIYERSLIHIIKETDLTMLRDETSVTEYYRLNGKNNNVFSSIDPALFSALIYKERYSKRNDVTSGKIVACLREFPVEYKMNQHINENEINVKLLKIMQNCAEKYDREIVLVPMHTFAIGQDDRVFLSKLRGKIGNNNVAVENKPLTLVESFHYFLESYLCIGMRYHSVVLQTVLNGRNIVLDYTDPHTGKIGSFMKQINAYDFYKDKYINLQSSENTEFSSNESQFILNSQLVTAYREKYIEAMKAITL